MNGCSASRPTPDQDAGQTSRYLLFHSPSNGIGIRKSDDLEKWTDWGKLVTLGQTGWKWAKGRVQPGLS